MKAMILAAGLGTRLRPLTEQRPKALVPIVNRPVIEWSIDYLKSFNIEDIAVNTHYHSQHIMEHLKKIESSGPEIRVKFEPELLGSGGGIKNFADFFDTETFVVMNGDIITDIDLSQAIAQHKEAGEIATLVLVDYAPLNKVHVNEKGHITDFVYNGNGGLAFASIFIMEPEILSHIPDSRNSNIITDIFMHMINSGVPINAHISKDHYWYDIGDPDTYIAANRDMLKRGNKQILLGRNSIVDSSAMLNDWVIVGEFTRIEKDSEIERSILWDNVWVKEGVKIRDSIVTSFKEVNKDLINEIY